MASLSEMLAKKKKAESHTMAPPQKGGVNVESFPDLENIDLADIPSSESQGEDDNFPDQIPVEVPARELPAELSAEQQKFITLLDSIHQLHHNGDAIVNAISNIMMDMRVTPHLANLVMDEDVINIVRQMKHIQGFRKATAVKKKASRATSKAAKSQDALASMLDSMNDLDLDAL